VVAIAGAFLRLVLILGIIRNKTAKAQHTSLEHPKRHRLALGNDGQLVVSNEDETPSLYDEGERQ
jgi:hypothetical protein